MKPPKVIIFLFLLFISIFSTQNIFSQQDPYFRIYENGKFGFIDSTGRVIIEPKFLNAGDFYEGLAPARLNGTFGYIDTTGNYVIPPIYDYAEEFKNGIAKVYIEERSFFINMNGNKFEGNYRIKENSIYGLKSIQAHSGKFGLINDKGELILDTIYKSIQDFYFPVSSFVFEKNDSLGRNLLGVIDSTGKIIIHPGEYDDVQVRQNFIYVFNKDFNKIESHLIDFSGKKIITVSYIDSAFPGNEYIDLMEAEVKSGFISCIKRKRSEEYKREFILLDIKGNIIFNDSNFVDGVLLNKNRLLLQDKNYNNWLMSLDGKVINEMPFGSYRGNEYIEIPDNGKILIMAPKWGIMDLNGKFILPPHYEELYYTLTKNIVVTQIINSFYNPMNYYYSGRLYGLANSEGEELIKPRFDMINSSFEIRNGIFPVIEHGLLGYVNIKGEYIWRQQTANSRSDSLNIDVRKQINFVVYTEKPQEQNGRENLFYNTRGWGNNYNVVEEISGDIVKKEGEINFYIKQEYIEGKKKLALYFVNDTEKDIEIATQDNQLFIDLEVQDETGKWRKINYMQPSGCGNSYYSILFPNESYCKFNLPDFRGNYYTKLRARLLNHRSFFSYNKKSKDFIKLNKELVSNEIYCSINPAQLWREKRSFSGRDLIDLMMLY